MQAFHVAFDFKTNQVGFGNKRNGRDGSFIYGIPEPEPEPVVEPETDVPVKDKDTNPIDPTTVIDDN